ncbi:hypothetical protein PIIN_09009 [Serendipita indica DSM 11827]|uniref:Uncharacterized protein n=1 Tax=Serendipita indica (strain DSM 11827) TaxID=1109443 RepID=G4TUN1_SERID|nr:hypothetical protein PIIN_09009 [Serendipita indica DSM 11827]
MPSFQGPLQELFQRTTGRLIRATIKGLHHTSLLIERARVIVLGSGNSRVAATNQPINNSTAESAIGLLEQTAIALENLPESVSATSLPSGLFDHQTITKICVHETQILDRAHDSLRRMVMTSSGEDATVLEREEAKCKEFDEQQSSSTLRHASHVIPSMVGNQAVALDLHDMDNEENIIKIGQID